MKDFRKGFTLLEILLVIGIIAILASIVIIAINPGRQLAQARNLERKSDLKQIDSALTQYYIDNNEYPASLAGVSDLTEICDTGASSSPSGIECGTLINLSELVPKYLTAIPTDPSATTTNYAGYKIIRTGKKIGLSAPAELEQIITIGTVPTTPAVVPCVSGDATNPDCWSTATSSLAWGPDVITNIQDETNGAANTSALILRETNNSESYPAARYCYDLNEGGHTDWYLPAINQLNAGLEEYKIQYNLNNTTWGGFADLTGYWSSTESPIFSEIGALLAYYYGDEDLVESYAFGKSYTDDKTRCIR